MDSTTIEKKIEEAVVEILRNSDMEKVTEYMVRQSASEELGINLSGAAHKILVRQVVESYLVRQPEENAVENQVVKQEEEEDGESNERGGNSKKKRKSGDKEYDNTGDLVICRLSKTRRVTLSEFKGMTLVSIREYYTKEDKELPSSKDNSYLKHGYPPGFKSKSIANMVDHGDFGQSAAEEDQDVGHTRSNIRGIACQQSERLLNLLNYGPTVHEVNQIHALNTHFSPVQGTCEPCLSNIT